MRRKINIGGIRERRAGKDGGEEEAVTIDQSDTGEGSDEPIAKEGDDPGHLDDSRFELRRVESFDRYLTVMNAPGERDELHDHNHLRSRDFDRIK